VRRAAGDAAEFGAAQVDAFCVERLGVGVAEHEFFTASIGAVHGLRLADGRRVVLKVHQASVDVAYLMAVADCQRLLSAAGFPCPAPHDARSDFEACTGGAAWIDTLAAVARQRNDARIGESVVGHTDWKVGHVRFGADGRVVAVFDWDSLALTHEPAAVGEAAHAFCADWEAENYICTPTIDEALTFITDCETARGRPFTAAERPACHAAFVYACAYTARCEDSDARTGYGAHPAEPAPRTVPATSYRDVR
jgi:hypothetical protein